MPRGSLAVGQHLSKVERKGGEKRTFQPWWPPRAALQTRKGCAVLVYTTLTTPRAHAAPLAGRHLGERRAGGLEGRPGAGVPRHRGHPGLRLGRARAQGGPLSQAFSNHSRSCPAPAALSHTCSHGASPPLSPAVLHRVCPNVWRTASYSSPSSTGHIHVAAAQHPSTPALATPLHPPRTFTRWWARRTGRAPSRSSPRAPHQTAASSREHSAARRQHRLLSPTRAC